VNRNIFAEGAGQVNYRFARQAKSVDLWDGFGAPSSTKCTVIVIPISANTSITGFTKPETAS
jgi:hypothetical protein